MAKELIEYVNPKDLIIIGLDTDDDETHPLFDERVYREVDINFVKNIHVYGVLQPVTVRKEAGKVYVVDGRQRVRAARKAAEMADSAGEYKPKVPTRGVSADDSRVQGIMVSTNELRSDDDVLTKAVKAERLLRTLGTHEEVAIAFGRSVTTIKNWLILTKANTRLHAAVKAGRLSVSAAIEVAKLKREDQKGTLDQLIGAAGGNTVSEAQAKAATGTAKQPAKAKAGGTTASGTGRTSKQQGIKRVWLRKALKTEAAKQLSDEQRGVLQWMATGEAEQGTWFDEFMWDAEAEIDSGLKKAPKVAKSAPKVADSAEMTEEMTDEQIAAELADLTGDDGEAAP